MDAPVSGGPQGALNGTLTVMVGGPEGAFRRYIPLLQLIGTNLVHFGPAGQFVHFPPVSVSASVSVSVCIRLYL